MLRKCVQLKPTIDNWISIVDILVPGAHEESAGTLYLKVTFNYGYY